MGRRTRKRRVRGALFIIAIAILIAGFMIRRLMVVGVMRGLRGPQPQGSPAPVPPAYAHNQSPQMNPNPAGEHISNGDRKKLDEVIRQKTGGGR